MFMLYVLLSALIFASSSHGAPSTSLTPCKADDATCMLTAAKAVFAKLLAGDKAIGVEPIDPLLLEEIDGTQTLLKMKMSDTTTTGYSKCELKDLKVDSKQMSFVLKLLCPHLVVKGQYEMDGKLIVLPVQGKGKFSLVIDVYDVVLTASYKIVKSEGGKEYVSIKTYQAEAEPKKSVKFEFQNLFNGKTELANTVHKFANENWKEVCQQFQGPIVMGSFKKIIKNVNKILKAMSMERVFL